MFKTEVKPRGAARGRSTGNKLERVFLSKTIRNLKEVSAQGSRVHFISFFENGEKETLHKSVQLVFEVAVGPTLGLVIPVYCRQTGFSSASINFYERSMVKTEPT